MSSYQISEDTLRDQVRELEMLLVACEELMISQIPNGSSRINFRRQCLTHMFALALNTADGAVDLIRDDNLFVSGILTRTLLEQWVNMQYIYLTRTYQSLVRYLYDGDASFIKHVGELKKIYEAINEESDFDDIIDDANGGIKFRISSSGSLKKYGYPLKRMPTFADRIRLIDEHNESMELITSYYYDYVHLSSHVHTTKDKIIEMTYASTYEEWRQATGEGDLPYKTALMLNRIGYIIEDMAKFYAKKHNVKVSLELGLILKEAKYKINISQFRV